MAPTDSLCSNITPLGYTKTTILDGSLMSSSSPALQVTGLVKTFDRPAVQHLDLTIGRGEFYALLGPNGAGKTTFLRMVAGLLGPDEGTISVCGIDTAKDPVAAKRLVAWVSDEPMVYDRLTPWEYLEFIAGLWQIPPDHAQQKAQDLLSWLGLMPHATERCGSFSKGMLQKVALAGALIHDPELIILDEPLTGLDAGASRQVKQVLLEKVETGVTIIMTTHILEVAERMAERIGVIARGRLIAEGTFAELQQQAATLTENSTGTSLEDVFLDLVAEHEAAA